MWFSTFSIDRAGDEWMKNYTASYTIEEINYMSRRHTITHVILKDEIPPNMNKLFPHLTHLRVHRVDSDADWTRYYIVII